MKTTSTTPIYDTTAGIAVIIAAALFICYMLYSAFDKHEEQQIAVFQTHTAWEKSFENSPIKLGMAIGACDALGQTKLEAAFDRGRARELIKQHPVDFINGIYIGRRLVDERTTKMVCNAGLRVFGNWNYQRLQAEQAAERHKELDDAVTSIVMEGK